MDDEEKKEKLIKWLEKEEGIEKTEKPIQEQGEGEEKLTEEEKGSSWIEGQGFGESKSILPRVRTLKIDPERIKDRIIDDINEMAENEEKLRQESERQLAEIDEGIKGFTDFLEEVKSKVEEEIQKALKEGKFKDEELDKKINVEFEKSQETLEERNKAISRLMKEIGATEAKRRKVIDRLEAEAEKLIAENKKVVAENKRDVAKAKAKNKEVDAENKKILAENERILAENEEIRKKNKHILERNRQRGR